MCEHLDLDDPARRAADLLLVNDPLDFLDLSEIELAGEDDDICKLGVEPQSLDVGYAQLGRDMYLHSDLAGVCDSCHVRSYDSGDFKEVENKVYAFSDSASGQTYWLAKSFIILGDSFVDRGELAQAKATFESVRDGYTVTTDDVLSEVNMRLEKLEKLIQSKK